MTLDDEIWPVDVTLQNKKYIKKIFKTCDLKISSRPFCVCKELSTTFIEKLNLLSELLVLDIY